MILTEQEVQSVAERLDDIIADNFHEALWDVYLQRNKSYLDEEFSDEDILAIKEQLKRIL
jgi:hypothetical protein